MVSVEMTAHADVVSGQWDGLADINVQEYFNEILVFSIVENNVPSTIDFTISAYPSYPYMSFSINNSIFPVQINVSGTAQESIIDGIPGQSADYATGSFSEGGEHGGDGASFNLVDPTGEFIGPNGNGSPYNVQISATGCIYRRPGQRLYLQ